ncbi:hypothetical protein P879_04063 [Paragonimus westermani]|uniref:Protein kish n=1 Tax=Paragonimus westermani TaxID=34504 RepID=A0A8T0DJE5_9TREM|nr:hypothetical protein P879_04063 [Paragonimus westermani]
MIFGIHATRDYIVYTSKRGLQSFVFDKLVNYSLRTRNTLGHFERRLQQKDLHYVFYLTGHLIHKRPRKTTLLSTHALFNFQSLLSVILLLICTCAYIRHFSPALLDAHKHGIVLEVCENW